MRVLLLILILISSVLSQSETTTTEATGEKVVKQVDTVKTYNRFDYQLGAGYNAVFLEDEVAFPAGFMLYGGVGVRLNRLLSMGLEYEFDFAITRPEIDGKLKAHLPKLYMKFKAADILAITGFAGAGLYRYEAPDESADYNSFLVGARATLFFLYAQYDMALGDMIVPKLGLGFSLSM